MRGSKERRGMSDLAASCACVHRLVTCSVYVGIDEDAHLPGSLAAPEPGLADDPSC